MKTSLQQDDSAKRPQPVPSRGAPATYHAHAVRKDVAVRVLVRGTAGEPEELREDGYGHGV